MPEPIDLASRHHLARHDNRDVFAKAFSFALVDQIRAMGIYPFFTRLSKNDGTEVDIDGRRLIMLGSNNYLGLTTHPRVREAAMRGVREYGTSMTGSRLMNGTSQLHLDLESALAAFVGKEAALVFATGYQTNIGVLTALVGPGTAVLLDRLDHASLHDAARLSRARVVTFAHNETADLDAKLARLPETTGRMVVVDGVYSMEGDLAPLDRLCAIAAKHGARVVVDDAHALGVIGEGGRGTASHFGVEDKVDLIVGTFSKSLASVGGFVAGPRKVIDFIQHFGRSMLFSASLPPASVLAAHEALRLLIEEPERVTQVNANAERARRELARMGFNVGQSQTPVVPIVVGDELGAMILWKDLLDHGVFTNCVLHPAVPEDRAMLRTSFMATHTGDQIDRALQIIGEAGRRHGLVQSH